MEVTRDLGTITRQERELILAHFDSEIAWQLGLCLRDWGFGNIGTESPVKPSSATIAALYELFLVSNRIAQWPQFAPRYGFGHRE